MPLPVNSHIQIGLQREYMSNNNISIDSIATDANIYSGADIYNSANSSAKNSTNNSANNSNESSSSNVSQQKSISSDSTFVR